MSIALWLWFLAILNWLITMGIAVVVIRRFGPSKAWAWLALMFGLPWVGLVLFLLLGEYPRSRTDGTRFRRAARAARATDGLSILQEHAHRPELPPHLAGIDEQALRVGGMPALGGNAMELISDYDAIADRMVEDIGAARTHVHMVFYIFRDDSVGRRVGEALMAAAERGVDCRLVTDAVGSRRTLGELEDDLRAGGVRLCRALPVNPFRGQLGRFDLRNHRKLVVIDGRVGYIGSWNALDRSFKQRRVKDWFDLMVRVRGPAVLQLQLLFLQDWNLEAGGPLMDESLLPDVQPAGEETTQTLPSDPITSLAPIRDLAVVVINRARERIGLTTPYLIPDETLLSSLWLAEQRGVEVDVIVPRRSDSRYVDAVTRSYCRDLARAGVGVHLFTPGILHAKTLLVDGIVGMVGSANFDMRSFRLNVEANLLTYSAPFAEELARLQQDYLSRSEPFQPGAFSSRPRLLRLADDYAKLFSPLF